MRIGFARVIAPAVVVAACTQTSQVEITVRLGDVPRDQVADVVVTVFAPDGQRFGGSGRQQPKDGVEYEFGAGGDADRLWLRFYPTSGQSELDGTLVFTLDMTGVVGVPAGSAHAVARNALGQAIAVSDGFPANETAFEYSSGFSSVDMTLACATADCGLVHGAPPLIVDLEADADLAAWTPLFRNARSMLVDDVNADGAADLILGAPDADGGRGEVYVLFGTVGDAVLGTGVLNVDAPTADVTLVGAQPGNGFGSSLAVWRIGAGGATPGLAIGAPGASSGAGRVRVFTVSSNGAREIDVISGAAGDGLGSSLASHHTTDQAVVLPAVANGRVYVLPRASIEVPVDMNPANAINLMDSALSRRITGPSGFGSPVVHAGASALISAPDVNTVWAVPADGSSVSVNAEVEVTAEAFFKATGSGGFGAALAYDSTGLIAVGAPTATNENGDASGAVYLFDAQAADFGSLTIEQVQCPDSDPLTRTAEGCVFGASAGDEFGASVGFGELVTPTLLVGAPGARRPDRNTVVGATYVVSELQLPTTRFLSNEAAPPLGICYGGASTEAGGSRAGTLAAIGELVDDGADSNDLIVFAPGATTRGLGAAFVLHDFGLER